MSVHVLYCVYWLCRFSPDDQLLAVGSADGHVTIYQTSPAQGVGTRYRQFKAANNAGITHVDWSQSGKYIQVGFIIGISGHPALTCAAPICAAPTCAVLMCAALMCAVLTATYCTVCACTSSVSIVLCTFV